MAFPTTLILEVQQVGNDFNGGGYDPNVAGAGSDYTLGSTQTNINYSDLVIQSTTTNVASATRPFVAGDISKSLVISSGTGFTPGTYTISSVSVGVATVGSSLGTASSTGGVGVLNPLTYTDLAIQSTTTNITSSNRPFTSSDVGNNIHLNGIYPPLHMPVVDPTGGGSTGGSLAAGAYYVWYTFVELTTGRESTLSPACIASNLLPVNNAPNSPFTVASGNKPLVYLPTLPPGVHGYNLYIAPSPAATPIFRYNASLITTQTYTMSVAASGSTTPPGSFPSGVIGGKYNIRSVSSGIATLDQSCGTAATSSIAGTLGGALASPGMASLMCTNQFIIWIKGSQGTYPMTKAFPWNDTGAFVAQSLFSSSVANGYSTTRGDKGFATFQAQGITTAGTWMWQTGNNASTIVQYLILDANNIANLNGYADTSNRGLVDSVKVLNASTGFYHNLPTRCFASNCSVAGFANVLVAWKCEAQNCGIAFPTYSIAIIDCIIINCGTATTAQPDSRLNIGNTVYNCATGIYEANGWPVGMINNLIVSDTTSSNSGTFTASIYDNNYVYNASGIPGGISLSANPFNLSTSADVSLNSTTGGGALVREAGDHGNVSPSGDSPNYHDIGAVQHPDPLAVSLGTLSLLDLHNIWTYSSGDGRTVTGGTIDTASSVTAASVTLSSGERANIAVAVQQQMDSGSRISGALTPTAGVVADASATTSSFITSLTSSLANAYIGQTIIFTTGVEVGQSTSISAYNTSTKQLTLSPPLQSAPANGDSFVISTISIAASDSFDGSVTVAGYETGQDPATLLLVNPANKISTNSSNQVIASSVANAVTVGTNNDKTGYTLAGNGLDNISTTLPTDVIGGWNFRERMLMLFRRFFGQTHVTVNKLQVFASDGTTPLVTQPLSDDGTTQIQGEGS